MKDAAAFEALVQQKMKLQRALAARKRQRITTLCASLSAVVVVGGVITFFLMQPKELFVYSEEDLTVQNEQFSEGLDSADRPQALPNEVPEKSEDMPSDGVDDNLSDQPTASGNPNDSNYVENTTDTPTPPSTEPMSGTNGDSVDTAATGNSATIDADLVTQLTWRMLDTDHSSEDNDLIREVLGTLSSLKSDASVDHLPDDKSVVTLCFYEKEKLLLEVNLTYHGLMTWEGNGLPSESVHLGADNCRNVCKLLGTEVPEFAS